MVKAYKHFENIVRSAHKFLTFSEEEDTVNKLHPFEERNIHPKLGEITRKLFDDSHYAQATFEAFKYIDKEVQKMSGLHESGFKLMMKVFDDSSPFIKLTGLANTSEIDEQTGYKHIFSGTAKAIRNPRGHEIAIRETPDECLDHISLASLLLRRLNDAK